MPFSAVGDKKVGEGAVLFDSALVTPFHDLFHGCIVIGAFHCFDIVLPIVLFGRFTFDENDACRNRVRPLDVGIIKTFYAHRQSVEMQFPLDFFQETYSALFRVQLFRLFQPVGFVLFHIEDGKFKQFFLITALWNGEDDIFEFHIQFERHDDFAGEAFVAFAHFDDAQRKELFFGFVQPFFVLKGESLVDSSVRDMQVIDECGLFIGIFFNGEHVDIMQYVAHDF